MVKRFAHSTESNGKIKIIANCYAREQNRNSCRAEKIVWLNNDL